MKLSRGSRLIAALVALASMFSMQLAMAGYACPQPDTMQSHDMAEMSPTASGVAMPSCEQIDLTQATLCQTTAQIAYQSLDKPQTPHVHAFTAVTASLVIEASKLYRSITTPLEAGWLRRATAPSIITRHCRLRI
ncbi:MAG: hypothetical protein ABI228_01040 [Burkholderiaceae bacterium]